MRTATKYSTTKYSTISRISGAVAGLWLYSAGAAWAGGGGADFGTLTALLTDGTTGLCTLFNINPCPTVPSITQAALEVAALGNNHPEMLLLQNQFVPSTRVQARNSPAIPELEYGTNVLPFPLTSTTVPPLFVAATPGTSKAPATPASGLLSNLTPLAFISQSPGTALTTGTASVTQLSDTNADTFLYAVGLSIGGNMGSVAPLPKPDYVYFIYDDLLRFNVSFAPGTTIAKFTFPLRVATVVNGVATGVERAVPTTLNFGVSNTGDCSNSTVVGDFAGKGGVQTLTPDKVGIMCQVVLSASPASTQQHAIFEVAVPLLVTRASDLLYFYSKDHSPNPTLSNPVNSPLVKQGVYTAFETDTGHSLGSGTAIGLAPSAAPLCSDPSASCSGTTSAPATFPLCANLPTKTTSNSTQLRAAVGAFYAMATSGETLLSAALGTDSSSTCSLF